LADDLRIGKSLATPTTTGSSFDTELRGLLWTRCLQVTSIGLGISLILTLVYRLLIEPPPAALPHLEHTIGWLRWGHLATFATALILLLLMQRWLCHLKLMVFAFMLFAVNIVVAVIMHALCQPNKIPFFEIALLLFLPASLIPWRTFFQVGLGAVALSVLAGAEIYFQRQPGYMQFWLENGGSDAYVNHLVVSATGTIILGAAGVITSRTLYSLRKSVHHAKRLGNYLIKKELGQGGMGKVYLAEHALIVRPTAVKVLEAGDTESLNALQRFEQEVQLSASLTHPNTISIYDYGRSGTNVFFYAMEYLDGMDLEQFVQRFGPLSPARVVHILEQACGSLAEAHARGIIHRDIKPSNLFLTQRGGVCDFVKVLDFGLAKQVKAAGDVSLTKSGTLFGTPRYIAPEAIYGSEKNDARSDLYNLGGVAYWLLTGRPPFASDSSVELLVDHVKTVPERPSELVEMDIPPDLENIVMQCLEKAPADRFQSATELRAALKSLSLAQQWDEAAARKWWELHGLWHEAVAGTAWESRQGAAVSQA